MRMIVNNEGGVSMMRTAILISMCLAFGQAHAGDAPGPEDLGAYNAHISDRAEVEMLVDAMKAVSSGHQNAGIVRDRLVPGFNGASSRSASSGHAAGEVVSVNGTSATWTGSDGSVVTLSKLGNRWFVAEGTPASPQGTVAAETGVVGTSAGLSFIETPVSRDLGIDRLTRATTRSMLGRALMSAGGPTASYYSVHYLKSAPFVRATYIQFVVDREWNRILYGNMDHWIRSYDPVSGPSAIETDASGRVFVSETGKGQVSVFQISGEGEQAVLSALFSLNGLTEPGDLSSNDNGTPLDVTDDYLYVVDAGANMVRKYTLGVAGGSLVASFEDFENPTAVCSGRWNGSNNTLLYVVDQSGKRVAVYQDEGTSLSLITEIKGTGKEYFQDIRTDHFGNIYLVESMHGRLLKYTADLHYLDSDGGGETFSAPGYIDIPFGQIDVEGEGTFRAGFDQLFTVERWGEASGVQRRTLGLALRDIRFTPDADVSTIASSFVLTDFGDVSLEVLNASDAVVRTVHSSWMTSGAKSLSWDRRDENGSQVAPGLYRIRIEGASPYRDEATRSESQFYLPMYYWQDAGSDVATDDAMLVQGSAVRWGSSPSNTANEHAASVQYRFTGLNRESEYMIAAEYTAPDQVARLQDMTVNGVPLHGPVTVSGTPYSTGWKQIPKEALETGAILVSVNRKGEGSAVVSQIWLKETGVGFNPQPIDGTIPTAYALEQNYPNPFNPSTVIRYSLPVDGKVSLTVFDITGREVVRLVDEQKRAGAYEATFDARGLSSGVYFYRVQTGQFSEAKKMILLK